MAGKPLIVTIRSNGQITLPTPIRRQANLEEGDSLRVEVQANGSILLVPLVLVERSSVQGEGSGESDSQDE